MLIQDILKTQVYKPFRIRAIELAFYGATVIHLKRYSLYRKKKFLYMLNHL
jgi:hypothetical protein